MATRKTTQVSVWHGLEIEREITEKVQEIKPAPWGGEGTIKTWHSVVKGKERVWVAVTCDWSALQVMLHAAARNKSGKSQDGAFTAIVERRQPITD